MNVEMPVSIKLSTNLQWLRELQTLKFISSTSGDKNSFLMKYNTSVSNFKKDSPL